MQPVLPPVAKCKHAPLQWRSSVATPSPPPTHSLIQVGQALSLSQPGPSSWSGGVPVSGPLMPAGEQPGAPGSLSAGGSGGGDGRSGGGAPGGNPSIKPGRVAVVARDEPLRTAVERLAMPGVRRLVVVQRGTGAVSGVVSLSDVAQLLFM